MGAVVDKQVWNLIITVHESPSLVARGLYNERQVILKQIAQLIELNLIDVVQVQMIAKIS